MAALSVAVTLALSACSVFAQSVADRVIVGVPDGFQEGTIVPDPGSAASPRAGWVSGEEFAIVLWGSSSCPPLITKLTAVSADEIAFSVDFSRRGRGNCTDDAVLTTHVFQVPPGITERPVKLIPDPSFEIDHILLP